jgi:hypothetical protein
VDEYICREEAIKELREVYENEYPTASGDFDEYASHDVPNVLRNMKPADVQPLSVVAEHIKKRLYETAFNTTEAEARNAIADMAGRIDFWINELKDGEHNDT